MIYRTRQQRANRHMLGLALARARAQGEAEFRRAQERAELAPLKPNPDVHEHAGFAPASLEPAYRLED